MLLAMTMPRALRSNVDEASGLHMPLLRATEGSVAISSLIPNRLTRVLKCLLTKRANEHLADGDLHLFELVARVNLETYPTGVR